MSAKKVPVSAEARAMQLLGRLVRNRMVSAVLMLCGFALAAWGLWRLVERQVLAAPAYRLTAENVEIPPRPEWIRGDVRADVFRDASLDGPLSVVQTADLVERLRNAFRLHPWIASVDRVQIVYPAAAKVQCTYRRPVCMIQVAGAVVPVPIDAEGVVLPGDEFAVVEALRYPRVCGIAGAAGPVGARWNDCRVLGAARLIERLGPAWQRLGLERLEVSAASALPRPRETVYTLVTRGGTQLIWGRAPGDEIAGERPAKEKLACLQRYADEGWTGGPARPQAIDLTGL